MKNRNSLLWIQIMLIRCSLGSIIVSSDFTIQPSLDISSFSGSDIHKSISMETIPLPTTMFSGTQTKAKINTLQSLSMQSKLSHSSAESIETSHLHRFEHSSISLSGTEGSIQQISTYESQLPTTKQNSVIKVSVTNIKTLSQSIESLSTASILPVSSLETVITSSYVESKNTFSTEYAHDTIDMGSKSSLKTSFPQQALDSKISTSLLILSSTSKLTLQSAKSTDVISISKTSSVYESDFQTFLVLPISKSLSQKNRSLASGLYTSTLNGDLSSTITALLSTDSNVLESESIQSSEFNSMHIHTVISGSVSHVTSTEKYSIVASETLILSSPTSFKMQPTPTILVISGPTESPESVSIFSWSFPFGAKYSSLTILKSSVASIESITQIKPSHTSSYSNTLNTKQTASSIFDGIKDSKSVSIENLSILHASGLSSSFVSSTDSSGITYFGKLISDHFKETVVTYLNSQTVSSLFTSSIDSITNTFNFHSSLRVNTDLKKLLSTVESSSTSSTFSFSTALVYTATQSLVESLSITEFMTSMTSIDLQKSMSSSSSMYSLTPYVTSNSLNKNKTHYTTKLDVTNTQSFVSPSESNLIQTSRDAFIQLTTRSDIKRPVLHGSESLSSTKFTSFTKQLYVTETLPFNTISNSGTSVLTFSQTGVLITKSSRSSKMETYYSSTEPLDDSSMSKFYKHGDEVSTFVNKSAILSSNTDLLLSSSSRESSDMTKTYSLSSTDSFMSTALSLREDTKIQLSSSKSYHLIDSSSFEFSMPPIKSSVSITKALPTEMIKTKPFVQTLTFVLATSTYVDISQSRNRQSVNSDSVSIKTLTSLSGLVVFSTTKVSEVVSSSISTSKVPQESPSSMAEATTIVSKEAYISLPTATTIVSKKTSSSVPAAATTVSEEANFSFLTVSPTLSGVAFSSFTNAKTAISEAAPSSLPNARITVSEVTSSSLPATKTTVSGKAPPSLPEARTTTTESIEAPSSLSDLSEISNITSEIENVMSHHESRLLSSNLLSSKNTDVLVLSFSKTSKFSPFFYTLSAQSSIVSLPPISLTPSFTRVATEFSPVLSASSTPDFDQITSILTFSTKIISLNIAASSVQSRDLGQTDIGVSSSLISQKLKSTSNVLSSENKSTYQDKVSTIFLSTSGSGLLYPEKSYSDSTFNPSTVQSIIQISSSGSISNSYFTFPKISWDFTSRSYEIKSETVTFSPSTDFKSLSTIDGYSKGSSLTVTSFSKVYTLPPVLTSVNTYGTDFLTHSVFTNSTIGLHHNTISSADTLMSQVQSTVVSELSKLPVIPSETSSDFSLISSLTKSGTIHKTGSLFLLSTSTDLDSTTLTKSGTFNKTGSLFLLSTSADLDSTTAAMDQITITLSGTMEESISSISIKHESSATPALSTINMSTSMDKITISQNGSVVESHATVSMIHESSLPPSFSPISTRTDTFTSSSINRSDNTSLFYSSKTYLSGTQTLNSEMSSFQMTFVSVASNVDSKSSLEIATKVESITEQISMTKTSSSHFPSKLTVSDLLLSSSQTITVTDSTREFVATPTLTNFAHILSSTAFFFNISSSHMLSLSPTVFKTATDGLSATVSPDIEIRSSSSFQSSSVSSTPSKFSFGGVTFSHSSMTVPAATDPLKTKLQSPSSDFVELSSVLTLITDVGLSTASSNINLYTLTTSLSVQSLEISKQHTSEITTYATKQLPASTPSEVKIYSSVTTPFSSSTFPSVLPSILTPTTKLISTLITDYASTSVSNVVDTSSNIATSISVSGSTSLSTPITIYTSTFLSGLIPISVSTPSLTFAHISESLQASVLSTVHTTLSPSIPLSVQTSTSSSIFISEPASLFSTTSVNVLTSSSSVMTISKSSYTTLISLYGSTFSSPFKQISETTFVSTPSIVFSTPEPSSLMSSTKDYTPTPAISSSKISDAIPASTSIPFLVSTQKSVSKSTRGFSYLSKSESVFVFSSRYFTESLSAYTPSASLGLSQIVSSTLSLSKIRISTSKISSHSVSTVVSTFAFETSLSPVLTTKPTMESLVTIISSVESWLFPTILTQFSISAETSKIHPSGTLVLTEIKSTPVYINETTLSKTYSSSTNLPLDMSTINKSTVFVETSVTPALIQSESLDFFFISVTPTISSFPITKSSFIFTTTITTTTPEQTTLNASNAKESNWARTVLKIQRYINISDPVFVKDLEGRLAEAFNEAFIRQKLIKEAKFEPLEKRRRRKRFTRVGDASVHIHDVSRVEDTTEVTAVYAVERTDKVLTAEEAVAALDMLNTQELAIILKQVVDVKAEPYTQTEKPSEPDDEMSQLLLYGAIAGGVGGTIILIWIAVCIYCKCCGQKSATEDAEPELTSIQPQSSNRKDSTVKPLPVTQKKKSLATQGSKFSLRKGRSYEINDGFVQDKEETDEQTLLKSPKKKKLQIPDSPYNGSSPGTPVIPKKELVPPVVKKGRRNSKNSIGPTSEGFENEFMKLSSPRHDRSQMFQSSISEDSEDTKLHLKSERKKNKERMAEKYGPELEARLKEREQPKTQSNFLGMPTTTVPSFVIESGSPVREPLPLSRQPSEGNTSGDENLEQARNRMHKLLDEAFSLISPRNSLTENDLRKHSSTDKTKHLTEKYKGSKSTSNIVDMNKALDTLKGFTSPGYTSSYSDFLETWSPYRSSDQVALISMPNKSEPAVTRLGNKSEKRLMTSSIAANGHRRPAANFEISNIKSITEATDSSKYATTSPKPIVIRTKDDTPNSRLASAKSSKVFNESQHYRNFSATALLSSDIFVRGSSTSLNKHQPQPRKANDTLEMQTMKRNRKNSLQSQRESEMGNRNKDEIDVIKNIKHEEANDRLYKSLKDEIKGLGTAETTEDDINKKPIRRRNRKTHSKPMTDIV